MIRCPHCQEASVFSGFLSVHSQCPGCGYDLAKQETADGPAFLVMTIMGFLICGLAAWVELKYEPPMWLHAAIWFPAIIILSPLMLRWTKGWMINYQYNLMKNDD